MLSIKKVFFFLLAFSLVFALTACGGGSSQGSSASGNNGNSSDGIQKLTIKISHVVAENTPKHQGALAMKKYIEKESGGKIKVQVYPNSQLFGDKDEYENLVANNVQFIIPDMAKLVGHEPGFNIPSMPFLFDGDKDAIAFWDGPKGQEIFKRLEKDGVLGLAMWPNGPKQITNNERPIKKPEDLAGLKFRTQGGQVLEKLYSTLKAGSVSIPFDELYTALQQGTVDGQENTYSNIESKKFDEVQKYLTETNHTRVDYVLLTNTKFWNSLNEKTKKIIQGGVEAGTKVAREQAAKLNADAKKKIEENGHIKIHVLTPEEKEAFRKALQPVYDEYTPIIGKDIIDDAMSR